ncbi:MAG: 50S ribosomal protein L10 [Patescibacteria group bacterium]|nr:50S ribosomal protein L10 [Patescibacteria group bacterium]
MAKTKQQKQTLLKQYKELLTKSPNYILVSTDQSGTSEITQLKKALQECNSEFHVVKNTLFKIAAEETKQPLKVQEITEATGIITCGEEPTAPAKILSKIQKEYEILENKFGVMFGEIADEEQLEQLAEIPSRDELLAKLVGSMQSPISGFVHTLQGNMQKFVVALMEIQKSKSQLVKS